MSRHIHTFADGSDMSELNLDFLKRLLSQRDKAAVGLEAMEKNGGWRLVVAITGVVAPATGWNVYELDATRDYRDRLWFFSRALDVTASRSRVLYPGHPEDTARYNRLARLGVPVTSGSIYYTRTGYQDPPEPPASLDGYFEVGRGGVRMWARASDGALMLGIRATSGAISVDDEVSVLGQLYVSPVTNERSPVLVPGHDDEEFFSAKDGEPIEPHDLNNLQDGQHMGQLPPGPASFALGPILHGDPAIPYEWNVRGETVRQRLLDPQLRRYVSFEAPGNDQSLLDRSYDWRDRHVHVVMWYNRTGDIRPGNPYDTGGYPGTLLTAFSLYTGGGVDEVAPAVADIGGLHVDPETGYLYWRNTSAQPLYANALLFATPRLGPRSAGLPSPRLVQDPVAGNMRPALQDSASSDLEAIVARWRMDAGLLLEGGRVAAIADQSGNGRHLVQGDSGRRAAAPYAWAGLNGAEVLGLSGQELYETAAPLPGSTEGYSVIAILAPADTTVPPFSFWELPGGPISTRIEGSSLTSEWRPDAGATPYKVRVLPETGYQAGQAIGIVWNFSPGGGAYLEPEVYIAKVGGGMEQGWLESVSPPGDPRIQPGTWRFFEGFRGRVAEVIVCAAVQPASAVFNSLDIASRYGF